MKQASMFEHSKLMVLLINLRRSHERRQKMEVQLKTLGISYEILNAVDGRQEKERLFKDVAVEEFRKNVGREVLDGEIGCYHSHLKAWRQLMESECESLLVLEDDVVFCEDFIEAVRLCLLKNEHWDIVKLNRIRAKLPICKIKIEKYRLNAYLGPLTGMGAYLIKRQVVARMLPNMIPIRRPIDHEIDLLYKHKIRHYGLEPFPSYVDDGNESTITGSHFSEVKKYSGLKSLPKYYDRIKNRILKAAYLARV